MPFSSTRLSDEIMPAPTEDSSFSVQVESDFIIHKVTHRKIAHTFRYSPYPFDTTTDEADFGCAHPPPHRRGKLDPDKSSLTTQTASGSDEPPCVPVSLFHTAERSAHLPYGIYSERSPCWDGCQYKRPPHQVDNSFQYGSPEIPKLIWSSQASGLLRIDRQFQMIHDRGARRQHLRSRRFSQNTKIICIIDNLRIKPLGVTQQLSTQYESAHVDIAQQR